MTYAEKKSNAEMLKGNYQFRSPYHKGRKMLPFNVLGTVSFNDEFPIEVRTVQYRGWKREDVFTSYKIETIVDQINSGKLIKIEQ